MKVFTTASVLSVAGVALVAVACSSSETTSNADGDGGASSSSSSGSFIEGGSGSGGGGKCTGEGSITVMASPGGADAGGCPKDISLTSLELDQAVGWKCPAGKKGSCTADEIAAIEKNLEDPNVKSYFDITKDASDACKACAVSKNTDSAWSPIVGLAETNGETAIINYGACFGFLIGATCGRSVQYLELCLDQACGECATSSAARKTCIEAASAGACKGFVDSVAKECPLLANAQPQCSDIVVAIKTICGP
jgi:hypothetical protein